MGRETKAGRGDRKPVAQSFRSAGTRALRSRAFAIGGAVALVALVAFVVPLVVCSRGSHSTERQLRAAIVDQLSLRNPNPAFVDHATSILTGAGYAVHRFSGEEVDVGFYRDLAAQDFDIVVLRAHSAVPSKDLALPASVAPAVLERIMEKIGDDVLLFTSERYDENAYVEEQKELRLFPVVYAGDPVADSYFAISSRFVESSMSGRFDGATVILMGCSSLASGKTAAAFVDKGAAAVVGWSDTVSPEHTDAATERLLRLLLEEGLPLKQAVEKTAAELGPDPTFGAVLLSYP